MSAEEISRVLEVCFSFNVSGFLCVIFPLSFPSLIHIWQILAIILDNPCSLHLLLSSHTEASCLPGALSFTWCYRFSKEVQTYSSLYFLLLMWHLTCVCAQLLSRVWLFVTPWTVACQAPLSVEFSRQEYWVGCHFLPQGSDTQYPLV